MFSYVFVCLCAGICARVDGRGRRGRWMPWDQRISSLLHVAPRDWTQVAGWVASVLSHWIISSSLFLAQELSAQVLPPSTSLSHQCWGSNPRGDHTHWAVTLKQCFSFCYLVSRGAFCLCDIRGMLWNQSRMCVSIKILISFPCWPICIQMPPVYL